MPSRGVESDAHVGTVDEFDEHRGLGVVTTADGTRYPFHSTQIADGTRTVAVGATVRFAVQPGGRGRWEATAIEVVAPS